MNSPHPKVFSLLGESGVDAKIHDHEAFATRISSPQDFADALGYSLRRITKTVFLRSKSSSERYAVAVCGMDRKLDFKAIAGSVEPPERMEVASADDLDRITGYPKHGVSPLGLPAGVEVLLDESLLDETTVLVGGGAAGVEIELDPSDLAAIAGARIAKITQFAVTS